MDDVDGGYEGKTVLVTGGAGAIGGNLVRRLNDLNTEKIVILDNLSSSYEWNVPVGPKIRFVHGDILDDEKLKFVFKDRPDIVFHLAAHFANQNSVDNPKTDLMVNGMGILKVLEFAHLTNVSRFVYASSGCGVYGLESTLPYQEHDVSISLHTPYQVTKLLGELYTNYYHNLYGLPVVNTRFFNSYGPGEVPGKYRNVIPNFFYWAMSEKVLPITGDGTETRVIDMAHEVNRLTGNALGVVHVQRRDWDAKTRIISSIDKAQRLLGYRPQTTFNEGLKHVHEWFVENWDDIERGAEF